MTFDDLDDRLGRLLLNEGRITPQQLEQAKTYQAELGGELSKILIKLGYLAEKDLAVTLERLDGVAYTDLSSVKLSPSLMGLLPRPLMEERLVLPIKLEGDTLTVAMAEPANLELVETVRFDAGYNINPVLALGSDIRERLNHYYYDGRPPQRTGRKYGLSDLVREIQPIRLRPPQAAPKTATADQKAEALKALLIRKGVVSEEEYIRVLNEIRNAR